MMAVDNEALESDSLWTRVRYIIMYYALYLTGVFTLLVIIAEPFAMTTYFSDNSLLPGLANREFSLVTEAEYYLKSLEKIVKQQSSSDDLAFATRPQLISFIANELDNFGLEVHQQAFSYNTVENQQLNGTNIYSIIRGERSTSSESIALCAPLKKDLKGNTLPSIALALSLAKYFSGKSYWAKDVIILFVDRAEFGVSAWLDSYYDIRLRTDMKRVSANKETIYYDSLPERSGPMQAAIVVESMSSQFSRINIKLQGAYGQLPNLDLFNLVVEMSARESITPYFHDKSLPYGIDSDLELYKHNFETSLSFIKNQASMMADGLHGHFLRYSIQSLTIEAPKYEKSDGNVFLASLLNLGRLVEGVFRSLNNLTERFNRSYYFYILISLRRFTSIGYYMIGFALIVSPLLLKAYRIHQKQSKLGKLFIGYRGVLLLVSALSLSFISTFNISSALVASIPIVPILILI